MGPANQVCFPVGWSPLFLRVVSPKRQTILSILTVSDAQGQPVLAELTKGKHVVRMVNLGGKSGNGGTGIDRFEFFGKDVDPSVLGKSNF